MSKLTENAIKVLEKRYLLKDAIGNVIETPEQMFQRVAKAVAQADRQYIGPILEDGAKLDQHIEELTGKFYTMMTNLEFLPNSPTLMNAGRPNGQLSACFVLPVEDSMESIFDAIKNAALIHKSGGGTGFNFSKIRPAGSTVSTTGGVASGPISFMKVFNAATEAVKQGGVRRGANMAILRVDHPDILDFITCKQNHSDITNFNLSVGITQKFMDALEQNTCYRLVDPSTGEYTGNTWMASYIWNLIIENAFKHGEPGIIFLDRLEEFNPTPHLGTLENTNPCGEQPLLPNEACNLGSINLSKMIRRDKRGDASVDWPRIKTTVRLAVHFLDNVIDINCYPLPQIEDATLLTRKIGLGVMGWADMLVKLKIPYDSTGALTLAKGIMDFINTWALAMSLELAGQRGQYPGHNGTGVCARNATRTTIAPTGTLSIIAGCSSGIEPLYAIAYERDQADMKMVDRNPLFEDIVSIDFWPQGNCESVQNVKDLPKHLKNIFKTAHDISPQAHVSMQAAFQRFTDNAVSKTINLRHDATVGDVGLAYGLAYTEGCKGITVYVDGSRDSQVLTTKAKPDIILDQAVVEVPSRDGQWKEFIPRPRVVTPRERPTSVSGITEKVQIGCGNLYVTINSDDVGVCEILTNTGRAGGCSSQSEATSRVVSIALRSGVDPREIVRQLKGIRCPSTTRQKGLKCTSCPDGIGRLLEQVLNVREMSSPAKKSTPVPEVEDLWCDIKIPSQNCEDCSSCAMKEDCRHIEEKPSIKCPECGQPSIMEGGCSICKNCGFSKCG